MAERGCHGGDAGAAGLRNSPAIGSQKYLTVAVSLAYHQVQLTILLRTEEFAVFAQDGEKIPLASDAGRPLSLLVCTLTPACISLHYVFI